MGEKYIKDGYEIVFRRNHAPEKGCDLTIKNADDKDILKNIEVNTMSVRQQKTRGK